MIDPLGQTAAVTVGGMFRESGSMSIILTGRESDYPPGILTVDIDSPGMLGFH